MSDEEELTTSSERERRAAGRGDGKLGDGGRAGEE